MHNLLTRTPVECHYSSGTVDEAEIIISYHSSPVAPQRTVGRIAIAGSSIGAQAEHEETFTRVPNAVASCNRITTGTICFHVVAVSVVVCPDHQGIGGPHNHQLVYARSGRESK